MTAPIPPIRFARDLDGIVDTRSALARAVASGRDHRVARGAYVPQAAWAALTGRQQYLLEVQAVARTRRSRPVLSHESAAVLWNLPLLTVPGSVHISTTAVTSNRSSGRVTKHLARLDDADVVERDGILVTSIERTVLDLAATTSFAAGVLVADRAILADRWGRVPPLTTRERLLECWARAQPLRAHARTRSVILFAETGSESPLESVSRVSMWSLGCPRPQLQVLHSDQDGDIGWSDFGWQEYDAVGEADGDGKYLDPAIRGNKSIEQVVFAEKLREDRIRALPKRFARWRWNVGVNPDLLRWKLLDLGLPLGKRWSIG